MMINDWINDALLFLHTIIIMQSRVNTLCMTDSILSGLPESTDVFIPVSK